MAFHRCMNFRIEILMNVCTILTDNIYEFIPFTHECINVCLSSHDVNTSNGNVRATNV